MPGQHPVINGRGFVVLAVFALVLMATCTRARAADLPPGVDCQVIRMYVAQHGKIAALAWARREGYSWAQISAARRCLASSP
jgi:hypothetical protein